MGRVIYLWDYTPGAICRTRESSLELQRATIITFHIAVSAYAGDEDG
jgi:hypothetical protein